MTQRGDSTTPPLFFLLAVPLLVLLVLLLPSGGAAAEVGGTPWASPALEALDERHDAEIFEAVVQSMAQWQKRHEHKKYQREKRASESVVCYEGVGCFRDAGPFSYLDMLPSSPDEVSTQFLFYTRHRPHGPSLMVPFSNLTSVAYSVTSSVSTTSAAAKTNARPVRDSPSEDQNSTSVPQKVSLSTSFTSPSSSDSVTSTNFSPGEWLKAGLNVSAPTKVIVHGFGSSCSNIWVFEMRSALMSVEECNVICVDWEAGATIPNYVRAAANTRLVGKQLALLLGRLRDSLGLDLQRVHLIGFSLGAHVAGFAGSELQNLSRITGLDPAGPLFENQDPAARLDSTDATFVDVIHSNGENLILGGLGSWQPMGHVDFYPNGGRMQKGCSNLFVGAVSDIFWSSTEAHGRSLCNHRRAYKFFTDSVSPRCHFPAVSCESYERFLEGNCFPCSSQNRCGNMGYYADRSNGRGTLYLITRDDEPFCAHQYLVKVESTPSALPVVSYGKIQITVLGASPDANETFTLTHKDDEELQAGGSLSRIVVPHPVMEEPVKVEVLYTAYSGWISSGLARWSIDKVTIGDSFGKSSSYCNKGLILDSGMPVTLPLYPGDCNPPHEAIYTSSLHLPMQPSIQIDSTNSSPSKDNWSAAIATENNEEVKTSNKAEHPYSPYTQQTTRIPTQVVYAGDDGMEVIKGTDSTKKAEETNSSDVDKMSDVSKEWENKKNNKNATKSEVFVSGASGGQGDPFLNPPRHSGKDGLDEQDSSWQPFSNDSPSNSLSPDGAGSREDAARAFIDVGEATNNIKKRNDSPQIPSEDPNDGRTTSNNQSKTKTDPSTTALMPQWRPRHIPMYSPSLYEPRGGWHPEMTPPELDPPPIHAPLTWHHWIGYNDKQPLNKQLDTEESNSSSITNSSDTETTSSPLFDEDPTSLPTNATTTGKAERGPFAPVVETVQLLPQRLAAFLARAEEYARVTLSGMVMGVGGGNTPLSANDSGEGRRKPKYFPPMSLGINLAASSTDESHTSGSVAPMAVPSKASSVSAMGRGLPQYYPWAIVGQGKEQSFGTESDVYSAREKNSQENKSTLKVDHKTSDSKAVDVPSSDTGPIQAAIRPQRGIITTASQRMLDATAQGKDIQHWQKLDGAGDHHQPRYIPLRRMSTPRASSRPLQRRGPIVMPRRR